MLPSPRRKHGPELLDLPEEQGDIAEFERGLREIELSNTYLGGTRAILLHLRGSMKPGETLSVVDIACGGADIPAAILSEAKRRGASVSVTAFDYNPKVVGYARRRNSARPEISLLVADALGPPFPEKSFDVAICSLTLHHFDPDGAARVVASAARLAKKAVIISDLRRSQAAYWLFRALSGLVSRNRFTRHDGPLSILRAFTPEELEDIARRAGLRDFRVVKHAFWRMTLVGRCP